MKIEVTQTLDLEIPEVPKHIKATGAKKATIPVAELPEEALTKIGEAWTINLLKAAGFYRGRPDDEGIAI